MGDDNNRTGLETQTTFFRVMQAVAPVVVLIGTLYACVKFGVFAESALAPVDSPLKAAMILGLSLFPGGAFFIARGLVNWSRGRQSQFWPTVKAHVTENRYILLCPVFVHVWYVVNGIRYDKDSVQFRRFAVGTEVDVRFDPDDPEIAVLAGGDGAARFNIGVGILAIALPFVISWPLVSLGD